MRAVVNADSHQTDIIDGLLIVSFKKIEVAKPKTMLKDNQL